MQGTTKNILHLYDYLIIILCKEDIIISILKTRKMKTLVAKQLPMANSINSNVQLGLFMFSIFKIFCNEQG